MVIYIDVLFLENVVINYLILLVTRKYSKSKVSNLRLFMGALIGASYVVVLVFFPDIKAYYNVAAKIGLSLVITAVAFSPEKLTTFLKTLTVFYISTFIFAGAVFGFLYFNGGYGFVKSGFIYIPSKLTVTFLAVATVGIIVNIFWEIIQYRLVKEKLLIPLKISFESRIINIAALVDTGNSLHDPLTNMPVVVVEFKAIKDILPLEIQGIFEESRENDLNSVTDVVCNSQWFSRFRVIPFTSLGKENGMLLGFKPDYIEIGENREKKGVRDVIVGIYNRALSKNERYRALLSPELVS